MATYSKCRSCGEVKAVEEFHRLRITNGRREYNPDCKACVNVGRGDPPYLEQALACGLPGKAKTCPACGVEKLGKAFGYRMHDGRVYLKSWCMECAADLNQKRREDPAVRLYEGAKARAKKYGIEFTISKKDVKVPEVCPVFGVPLLIAGGTRTDNSPTLDRIDPTCGYTPSNVHVISWRANRLKSNMSAAELEALYKYANQCHSL
ncbi:hypothetical protein MAL1_00115 [Bacteriophage DSS3_MAL1]|nr:hypothetical protein MAL1_00115 [Bacteriophage DSS3_MAL1]